MDFWKVGPRIKEIRKKKGITQQELAEKAGLTRQSISNLERGLVGRVTIAVLIKALDALGYELDIVEKKPVWFFDPNELD